MLSRSKMLPHISRTATLPLRRLHPHRNTQQQHAAFSSTRRLTKKTNRNTQDEEPQIPAFKVSDIVSTRRGRVVFYSAVAILATMESLTWLKFSPKAFSKKEEGQQ